MINATDSPFSGGSITIVENNGRSYQFPYIKQARELAQELRAVSEVNSRQAGDVRNVLID